MKLWLKHRAPTARIVPAYNIVASPKGATIVVDALGPDSPLDPCLLVSDTYDVAALEYRPGEFFALTEPDIRAVSQWRRAKTIGIVEMIGEDIHRLFDARVQITRDEAL